MNRILEKIIKRTNRPRPIGYALTINALAIILFLGGSIMGSMIFGAQTAVKTLSRVVINQTFVQSEHALEHFLKPVESELQLACDRVREGLIDPDDRDQFIRLLRPFLERSRLVSSVLISDGRDHNWLLDKTKTECQVKQVSSNLVRPFFDAVSPSNLNGNNEKNVTWIPRHHQINPHEATSSAVAAIRGPDGQKRIIAFNLQVKAIAGFIQEIRPLEKGHTVIALPDGFLLGMPWFLLLDQESAADEKLPALPVLSDWSLGKEIAAQVASSPDQGQNGSGTRLVRKKINDTTWWAAGKIVHDNTDNRYHIFILLPEKVLIGALVEQRKWILTFTLLALVAGIYQVKRLARRYSQPVKSLVAQSRRISQGDLAPPTPIKTNVLELRQLAEAQSQMRAGLESLMKLERDLQIAKQIQQSSLPRELPQLAGFEIAAWNSPADETGGDAFDVIGVTNDENGSISLTTDQAEKAILLLADATGHGMGPALSVTQMRAMLRMGCHITPDLTQWVEHINEQLHDDLPNGRFITAWLGEIDSRSKALTWFSAGQGPLLHFRADTGAVASLTADTYPMGIMEEMEISPNRIDMMPGDIFAVISDGIFEANNTKKEKMGEDRICSVIQEYCSRPAEQILEQIQAATEQFSGHRPPDDDRTILIVKRI